MSHTPIAPNASESIPKVRYTAERESLSPETILVELWRMVGP